MKILVIVDMQNDFTSGVLGNNECEEVVSKVVEVINEDNYDKIFLTRATARYSRQPCGNCNFT